MTYKEAAQILEGVEEVSGDLPEDGLQVEIALSKAISALYELAGEEEELKARMDEVEKRMERCENCLFWQKKLKGFCPIAGERVSRLGHCSEWNGKYKK